MRYHRLTNNTYERGNITHEYAWWDNAFTNDELSRLESLCESEQLDNATTVGSSSQEDVEKVRRSKVKFFERYDKTDWIFERFNNVIMQLNEKYYNFDLNGYNMFQYTFYDSNDKGKYDWHMDTILGNSILSMDPNSKETRKLTMVMLLSEPNVDFCGGEFQFYTGGDIDNTLTPELKKGTIICFPSFLIHRVKPVLLGVRKSIVIWVTGPKFR